VNIVLYIIEGRRLQEHRIKNSQSGQIIGKFRLIHTEDFHDYFSAREHEKFLKSGKGRQWIKDNLTKTRPS
jgi:hypothetical protein